MLRHNRNAGASSQPQWRNQTSGTNNLNANAGNSSWQQQQQFQTQSRQHQPRSRGICKFYATPSGCRNGENCEFEHISNTSDIKDQRSGPRFGARVDQFNSFAQDRGANNIGFQRAGTNTVQQGGGFHQGVGFQQFSRGLQQAEASRTSLESTFQPNRSSVSSSQQLEQLMPDQSADLTLEDKAKYEAQRFAHGLVPEIAPPTSLCS